MLLKNPRRKIIWTYWQNPFGESSDEFVNEDEADVKSPWEKQENQEEKSTVIAVRPVVPTPMGFMPVQPFQSFNKSFEFWVAHTNFNVSSKVRDIVDNIPGVEIFDVISRYIFRICVGKAFVGSEVKMDIQRALDAMPPKQGEINPYDIVLDGDTEKKVQLLQYAMKDMFPFWAIYVMPNGEMDVASSNTSEGLETHIELYKLAQDLAGGVIYPYA